MFLLGIQFYNNLGQSLISLKMNICYPLVCIVFDAKSAVFICVPYGVPYLSSLWICFASFIHSLYWNWTLALVFFYICFCFLLKDKVLLNCHIAQAGLLQVILQPRPPTVMRLPSCVTVPGCFLLKCLFHW